MDVPWPTLAAVTDRKLERARIATVDHEILAHSPLSDTQPDT